MREEPCISSGSTAAKARWGPSSEQVQSSDGLLVANGPLPILAPVSWHWAWSFILPVKLLEKTGPNQLSPYQGVMLNSPQRAAWIIKICFVSLAGLILCLLQTHFLWVLMQCQSRHLLGTIYVKNGGEQKREKQDWGHWETGKRGKKRAGWLMPPPSPEEFA